MIAIVGAGQARRGTADLPESLFISTAESDCLQWHWHISSKLCLEAASIYYTRCFGAQRLTFERLTLRCWGQSKPRQFQSVQITCFEYFQAARLCLVWMTQKHIITVSEALFILVFYTFLLFSSFNLFLNSRWNYNVKTFPDLLIENCRHWASQDWQGRLEISWDQSGSRLPRVSYLYLDMISLS